MLSSIIVFVSSLLGRFTIRWLTDAEAGEEGCLGGLHVHFGAFGVEAVLADGDILPQGVVDARLQIPLCGKCLYAVPLLCADGGVLRLQRYVAGAGACHTEDITVNLLTFIIFPDFVYLQK